MKYIIDDDKYSNTKRIRFTEAPSESPYTIMGTTPIEEYHAAMGHGENYPGVKCSILLQDMSCYVPGNTQGQTWMPVSYSPYNYKSFVEAAKGLRSRLLALGVKPGQMDLTLIEETTDDANGSETVTSD